MRFLSILLALMITVTSCTATTTGADQQIRESDIAERMDRIGKSFAWYCGSEGVSLRAVVRVTAAAIFTIGSFGKIPDLCGGYNEARAEAISQIKAEREVLESGLLDLQSTAN